MCMQLSQGYSREALNLAQGLAIQTIFAFIGQATVGQQVGFKA